MEELAYALLVVYIAILGLLCLYGIHRYVILWLYYKNYRPKEKLPQLDLDDSALPLVAVQIPLYNEIYVAERIIRAVADLEYPRDRLEIQILDDSTDDTVRVTRRLAEELEEEGYQIYHQHRTDRKDFKAGALKEGLEKTEADFAAVFDADFIPPRNFLLQTLPYFGTPQVAMVQTRWDYLNRQYSRLTRIQALLLDGHFVLEHTARFASGLFFNFNGTAGIWRKEAIADSGGWQGDTLTEDLDLSYRAQMEGWKFIYLPQLECPSELPVHIDGFKSQQHRWTKGSVQVGNKLLPKIWRSNLPLSVKVEATCHLYSNLNYVLVATVSFLLPFSLFARNHLSLGGLAYFEGLIILLSLLPLTLFYLFSQKAIDRAWKGSIMEIPWLFALGIGMSINNGVAVLEALAGKESPFVRTAKYRIEGERDSWQNKVYDSLKGSSRWLELFLLLSLLISFAWLVATQNWGSLPFVALFLMGYGYVFTLSLFH